ncbi:MAG: phospholipid carrier-dependent glycosyltransferase, partial [Patescibacteria group bacterium]
MSTLWPRSVWIPVLALALVIFGWRLNSVPLTNWDEGIYANVNLELFRSHDWTKLTYFGKDFLEKPPLQFWLTYPLIGVFGPTELAMRLWSALAGAGTAVLLALWGWQATQKRSVAWLAGGLFVLGRFALIHAFRSGDLDGLLTFLIVLDMYGYWRS